MSVIQGFSESWTSDEITQWAHANPTVPRVIGIDVGQDKLTVWLGAPNPSARATDVNQMRFVYMAWILCRCSGTRTNAEACRLVTNALEPYRRHPFSLASDIVIEKQHKKNGRMKAIARAIRTWIRTRVPGSERMRVVDRQAMSKFANIAQLPCPMPRDYKDRKDSAERAVAIQVQRWAGKRWYDFYHGHSACADDLADAALIAQDYTIAVYPMSCIAPQSLTAVHRVLADRRARNTWRKPKKRRSASSHYQTEFDRDFDDFNGDEDDVGTRDSSPPPLRAVVRHDDDEKHGRERGRRRLEEVAVRDDFEQGPLSGVVLDALPLYARLTAQRVR